MLGKDEPERLQRYCRNCGAQVQSGTAYCVVCGQRWTESTDDHEPDLSKTDTTRYLCAAAYRDKTFRNQVIEQIVEEKYKAVGASYGVDIAAVAKHCLIAKRIKVIRDLLIAVLSVLWLTSLLIYLFNSFLLALLFAVVVPVVVWLALFIELWLFDLLFVPYFSKGNFDPAHSPLPFEVRLGVDGESKLSDVARMQDGNVVVYSGSRFSPFVGSGFDHNGWSFTLRVDQGREEFGNNAQPMPFELAELYDLVAGELVRFGLEEVPIIEDRLYVDGQEIRNDKRFLQDPFARPYVRVDPSLVKSFVDHPTQSVRYYKCAHVIGWKGELILSIFVRFAKVKNKLYAEASYFLLPPLEDKYHEVDAVNPALTLRKLITRAARAAINTVGLLFFAPLLAFAHILRPLERWGQHRQTRRAIANNLAYDYGARISVREIATSSAYRRYFQRLDKEMNVKLIERQILDSIIEFLDSKNIDTADLKDRQQTIFNEGVMISGGSIQTESLTVGRGAASNFTRVFRPKGN